jgi:hypothetical protein
MVPLHLMFLQCVTWPFTVIKDMLGGAQVLSIKGELALPMT